MDQAAVNNKKKADKKFNEQHDSDRADMVRGKRCAATGGDRLDEALTVKGEKGVFGKQYDEGHFYFLDDFLSIHCPGQKFGTLREKFKAVKAQNQEVHKDKFGCYGVNMITLPPKVAYKWQSGEEEQFKKVTMDDLEDADEANEHMQQMVDESGLQNQKNAAHAEELSEDEGPESPLWVAEAAADADGVRSSDSDLDLDPDDSASCAPFKARPPASVASVRSPGRGRSFLRLSPNSSRASSRDSAKSVMANSLSRRRLFTSRPPAARSRLPIPAFANASQQLQQQQRSESSRSRLSCLESNVNSQAADPLEDDAAEKKPGRRKAVQTREEAEDAYTEYAHDFTPQNMYNLKYKARDVNAAIDRLRKIGNKVACVQDVGEAAAADLAGKLVALADSIKPLWELMDALRSKAETFLCAIKPEWVQSFVSFPPAFKNQLISSIVLSQLAKLPNSTSKAEDVVAMMSFLSGHKYIKSKDHLSVLALGKEQAVKTQSHLVVVVLEATMKLSKVDFIRIMRMLRSEGLAPTLEDSSTAVWAVKNTNKAAGADAGDCQAGIDVHACSLMAYLLEADDVNYKKSRLFFWHVKVDDS